MRGVRIRLAQARQEPAARPLDSRYQELRCRRNTVASTNWSAELLRTCPPDEIQLICRWLNPASLRAYARLGTSTFMSWVDAAEKAVADSVQTSSLPNLLSCTLNLAGRSAHMLRPSSTRRLMTRRRQHQGRRRRLHRQRTCGRSPWTTVYNGLSSFRTRTGRRTAATSTDGGRGWTGRVVDVLRRANAVRVEFVHAADGRGLCFPIARYGLCARRGEVARPLRTVTDPILIRHSCPYRRRALLHAALDLPRNRRFLC